MQIFTGIEAFEKTPHRPVVLALGNFDGVHAGHQKILRHTVQQARELKAVSAALTFQQHPQTILRPDLPAPASVISPEHKLFLLAQLGIETCLFLPFTENFAKTEADFFLRDTLIQHLGMKKMCLGYNARFGRDRKGSPDLMRQLSKENPFDFEEIGPVEVKGEAVSSSRIRKLLAAGNLKEAAACLGRPFSAFGKVMRGDRLGRKIGFPTANMEAPTSFVLPFGVYPARIREVQVDQKQVKSGQEEYRASAAPHIYEGVMNYGIRPTIGKNARPILEVHLFDFEGDLYGTTLEVFIYEQLRAEQKFADRKALKGQIAKDTAAAKSYFASKNAPEKAQISAFTKKKA
jgi:riboflavin kinase / FMN adenylyltransferase